MNSPSLREFVDRALETRRIRFGDLRRLQRDILPGRISSPEEALLLLELDRAVRIADRDWSDYLVGMVRDYVIWGTAPAGILDRAKADWLMAAVSNGGLTKNGRAIFREVARKAPTIEEEAGQTLAAPKRPVSEAVPEPPERVLPEVDDVAA
jgi:hypothetical protein